MISSTAAYESIRDAATGGRNEKPARGTVAPYIDILETLWILEPVPARLPTNNRVSRLGAAAKHQLFDPAIAVRRVTHSTHGSEPCGNRCLSAPPGQRQALRAASG